MLVIEQLKGIQKIYDLMALCSAYILMKIEEEPYEFGHFNDDEFDWVYDAIERYDNEVRQRGHEAAFDELKALLIEFLYPNTTIEKCFAVIKYIDEVVDIELPSSLIGSNQIVEYSALNESYQTMVRIIPRMKDTLMERGDKQYRQISGSPYSLLRKKRDCPCSVLDEETINYAIWDQWHIERFPMSIYHVEQKHAIYKHFAQRKKIVFGIVPLTNKPAKQILEEKFRGKTFYIEQMYPDAKEELKERYSNCYHRAKDADIDFLIFPEMLVTEEMIDAIADTEKIHSPRMIVHGSIWKDAANYSIVTDGNGKEMFRYYKKTPYIDKVGIKNNENAEKKEYKKYKEWLDRTKNREYASLEIDGIGRIGIGICKDLINEEFKMYHKCMGTDILLIPAYTKSMDLHASAEGLAKEYNCIVVMANACSAFGESDEDMNGRKIGFVSIPAKDDGRKELLRSYHGDPCTKDCAQRCIGRKISIDFFHTKKYKTGMSYEVTEDTF